MRCPLLSPHFVATSIPAFVHTSKFTARRNSLILVRNDDVSLPAETLHCRYKL